jgi:hypothetical protein
LLRVGDRDRGNPLLGDRLARLTSVGAIRRSSGDLVWRGGLPWRSLQGDWALTVPETGATFDATFAVALNRTSDGYRYRGYPVKVGAPFVFETDRYLVKGMVLRIDAPQDSQP